jgi:ankyrin repeat protein
LTPLHIACIHGNVNAVKFLKEYDVDVESKSMLERTPTDEALYYKHFSCVLEMFYKKPNVEFTNNRQFA